MATLEAGDLLGRLGRGKGPDSLGLSRTDDGLVDLRGLRLAKTTPRAKFRVGGARFDYVTGKPIFEGLHIGGVDLSAAFLEDAVWQDCRFVRVRFDRCRGRGMNFGTSSMHDISFARSDLRGVRWGQRSFDGPKIEFARFIECDLRHSTYGHPLFRNCQWVNCKLKAVDLYGSRFEDCTFVGMVNEAMFHGRARDPDPKIANLRNPMRNVDFTKAELRHVSFTTGIDLTSCAFPTNGYLRIARPDIMYRGALERVEATWPNGKAKDRAVYYLKGMCAHFPEEQAFMIVRIADFDDWPGARDVGRRVLQELQTTVRTTV